MSVAVVIPCYRVKRHIEDVLRDALSYADAVYVVDDQCPERTADFVEQLPVNGQVTIVRNPRNLGVGGATIAGYRTALADRHDIIVKMDGDGQMDASMIPYLIEPIVAGDADYTKGNRFFNLEDVQAMPKHRLAGNAGLSFLTKLASGYWNIFDPTNGFTAIHARVVERIALDRVATRYFFESDMLFRLGTMRAAVIDVPMVARYGEEVSNLRVRSTFLPFLGKNVKNFCKRLFYNYFLRDFSVASVQLLLMLLLIPLGLGLGIFFWWRSFAVGQAATSGEVMLAALPLIVSVQLFLAFIAYDVESTPRRAIHRTLQPLRRGSAKLQQVDRPKLQRRKRS